MTPKKPPPTLELDVECYRNYFLIKFRNHATGNLVSVPMYEGMPLDKEKVRKILRQYRIVTFNGNNYDMIMVTLALHGLSNTKLKDASDMIIKNGLKPWHIERQFNVSIPQNINHIDIIEVAPGTASLKIYSGRLHCQKMQDLPIQPDAILTNGEMMNIDLYCGNDLSNTGSLFDSLKDQIELREKMTGVYGIDLRSKSDAQIAEAVIKSAIEKIRGEKVYKPEIAPGTIFNYTKPDWINFQTKQLQDVLRMVCENEYVLSDSGKISLPKTLADAEIQIGSSVYRMGIGGLHSSESGVSHFSDDDFVLIDRDVESYYPRVILNLGLYPLHLGVEFLTVYGGIVNKRLSAKKSGDKVTADSLKITINGSFGKFGSKYSILFAPNLLIQTTLTGQLSLLMLIEMLHLEGLEVVSANTDGIVIKCPRQRESDLNSIIGEWEALTNFKTEETRYKSIHSRDVNNYIAVKEDGKYKCKGEFAPTGLQKNPQNEVCSTAVAMLLSRQTPIEKSILECTDVRKFVTVRSVTGGGVWTQGTRPENKPTQKLAKATLAQNGWILAVDGMYHKGDAALPLFDAYKACFKVTGETYLGKAIRWYYAKNMTSSINYKLNGNKVPRSDNAKPIMDLPDDVPTDIDHDWYIKEAYSMLRDMGVPFHVMHPEFADLL